MASSPKLKPILYSTFSGIILIVFWAFLNQTKNESALPFWDILDLAFENKTENAAENATIPSQTPSTVPQKNLGPYTDGTYQASSNTPWGTLITIIDVKDGEWATVRYGQIPNSPPSHYAASYLAKQALKAQNEKIDGVSGATYTSNAFRDDLKQIVSQSKI